MARWFTRPLVIFAGALAVWLLIVAWLDHERRLLEEQEFTRELAVMETAYRAAIEQYRLMADTLFEVYLREPDTLNALARVKADGAEADRVRGQLYRRLAPVYDRLHSNGIRQMNLFTHDGRSFLRMHQPDKYGDALADVRPTVRIATQEKRAVAGFEVGRLISGFRFVWPLEQEGEFVGAAEIGLGFKTLRQAIERVASQGEYALLLAKAAVQAVTWQDRLQLYGPADLSPEYLIEDPRLELPDSAPRSPTQRAIDVQLAKDAAVAAGLAAQRRFARAVWHDGNWWVAAFLPITDVAGRHAAYLIGYTEVPALAAVRRDFYWQCALAGVGLLLLALARWRLAVTHARLVAEREELATITRNLGEGLYLSDEHGIIRFTNPAFTELLGWSEDQVVGQRGHCLFHQPPGEPCEDEPCEILATVAQGRRFTGEETFYRADGTTVPVEVASAPIMENGRYTGSVTVFRDISERQAAERALIEAKETAEAAARAKSEFLANMSHEIRTPMNGIIGMIELLLDTPLTAEQREQARTVRESAEHLLGIFNDILDFSKIEAGALTIQREPFEPRALAEGLRRLFQPLAEQKGLGLRVHLAQTLPAFLLGDALRIRQVLVNLIGNALKFTAQGEVALVLEWKENRLRTEVRDTGIGIAPETLARLFQPFAQADASTTRRYGGTGLGLALSKRLVERMGGEIGAQSVLAQGSTFWFEIPCPAAADAIRREDEPKTEVPPARGARILVAEDNAVNRRIVEAMLGKLGYVVTSVADGRAAVAAWEEAIEKGEPYALILMDVMMPELDGSRASAEIRQREAPGEHVPIIALTASVLEEDRARCLAAGMEDVLPKPVTRDALAASLARWLAAGTTTGDRNHGTDSRRR